MGKQEQGEGGAEGLSQWCGRCPDSCAQVAGTHVMGVGEVAHHGESPRNVAEVSGW